MPRKWKWNNKPVFKYFRKPEYNPNEHTQRLLKTAKEQTENPSKTDQWLKNGWERAGMNDLHPDVADTWNEVRYGHIAKICNRHFRYIIQLVHPDYPVSERKLKIFQDSGYTVVLVDALDGESLGAAIAQVKQIRFDTLQKTHRLTKEETLAALDRMTLKKPLMP